MLGRTAQQADRSGRSNRILHRISDGQGADPVRFYLYGQGESALQLVQDFHQSRPTETINLLLKTARKFSLYDGFIPFSAFCEGLYEDGRGTGIRPISLANFGQIGYTKWWQKPRLAGPRAHAISPVREAGFRSQRAFRWELISTGLKGGTS